MVPRLIPQTPEKLEALEKKASAIFALVGTSLMVWGLVDLLLRQSFWHLPGKPALSFQALWGHWPVGSALMSLGIVLLGLLPLCRVFLAAWLYGRRKEMLNSLVAVVVILELLLSMHLGK